jgi:antitoxin FitA
MSTLTIKNIPPILHRNLKKRAGHNHRSLNKEIIVCLEEHLRETEAPLDTERFLAEVRKVRERLPLYLSDKDIDQAINEGRE